MTHLTTITSPSPHPSHANPALAQPAKRPVDVVAGCMSQGAVCLSYSRGSPAAFAGGVVKGLARGIVVVVVAGGVVRRGIVVVSRAACVMIVVAGRAVVDAAACKGIVVAAASSCIGPPTPVGWGWRYGTASPGLAVPTCWPGWRRTWRPGPGVRAGWVLALLGRRAQERLAVAGP